MIRRRLSHHEFIPLSAGAAAGSLLAACVSSTSEAITAPPLAEKTTLPAWGGSGDTSNLRVFFDRYATEHPNVEFKLNSLGGEERF